MSETTDTQESFMSHLIELRMRLMRSIIAVVIVLLLLFPFAKDIYALLAQPLLRVLPAGSTMIATDVTGTKRLVVPVLVSSCLFFALGMSFAYFFVFPVAFGFFAGYTPVGVQMMTDIDKYLSFVMTMFIAFGLTFETPVVVVVLVRMRVVPLEKLRSIRPYVIVGAFVIGAIFTPPDVISQCLLAIPLWLLYELGLQLARFVSVPAVDADTETQPTS